MTAARDAAIERIRDEVFAELISCYGEGENTDWPYLTDLADLIVSMMQKRTVADCIALDPTGLLASLIDVVRGYFKGDDDDLVLPARSWDEVCAALDALLADPSMQETT